MCWTGTSPGTPDPYSALPAPNLWHSLGWIAAILAALSFMTIIGGWALGLVDSGDATDVNPNLGEFHSNDSKVQTPCSLSLEISCPKQPEHFISWNLAESEPELFCTRSASAGSYSRLTNSSSAFLEITSPSRPAKKGCATSG